MSEELTSLHKKTVGVTFRVQQIAFLIAAIAIIVTIFIINFQPPNTWNIIFLLISITMSFLGVFILLQTWWYTSIRHLIISPAEWYRLTGYNIFVSCILWTVFFLWQANLLNITSGVFLLGITFIYHRFNRNWARASYSNTNSKLAKGMKSR